MKIKGIRNNTNRIEIPHGYLSIGFFDIQELLKKYSREEIIVLVTAVAKHHIRDFDLEARKDDLKEEIERLKDTAKNFRYEQLPNIVDKIDDYAVEALYDRELREFKKDDDKKLYILVKGLLNKLDYAASGHYKVEYKNDFLDKCLEEHKKTWGQDADYNNLQKYMLENQNRNMITVAETGYGKTEAGLLWIGNTKGFFTLPLRSAINSIYDRIRNNILKEDKNKLSKRLALLHSDSLNELYKRSEIKETEERLYLDDLEILDYNDRSRQKSLPLTVSTIDQIFRFVYRYEGFEADLATLAYSKVVIDEIQMYSPDLLAYLVIGLEMISKVGGKFAIITATLPPFIKDLLNKRNLDFIMPDKPYYKKNRIRHEMCLMREDLSPEFIRENFKENKVLVIVNTVRKAQELYDGLEKDFGDKLNIFHGGYIKRDRQNKEKKIIEFGSKENKDSGIWICTQVAEASLDIDFDILITELSDLNGLFQRMGRCYRARSLEEGKTNVYVFDGGENLCTGIGYVNDKEIFNMSKAILRSKFDNRTAWRMTEKDKFDLIDVVYKTENIKKTRYYMQIIQTMNYVETMFIYEKSMAEVARMFRAINNIDVIPRCIYNDNKVEIEENRKIIKGKDTNIRSEKERDIKKLQEIKARIAINQLTVNIPFYFSNYNNTEYIEVIGHETINIYDCEYDIKFGVRHIKGKVDKEYRQEVENII